MQLRVARLCLDCEELHDARQCPVCASESFTYLTRWVPAPERRERSRAAPPVAPVATPQPQRSTKHVMIGAGVLGLGVVAAARWWSRGREKLERAAMRNAGELR